MSQSLSRLKTDWFCSESLWVTHSTNNCASLQGIAIAPEYQILVSGIAIARGRYEILVVLKHQRDVELNIRFT
ncbi:hypothetical protein [Cylindrospermopsis sp. CR12]|uniref:hypothetical protein n=1 Tax=Cylindrospermopsis sp. CR12 TaxID=1747196 RepID=UPI00128FC826|nr:hypothetical protein [Cylindrospermopsis sp. CR12]